jgi:hypothetical protein
LIWRITVPEKHRASGIEFAISITLARRNERRDVDSILKYYAAGGRISIRIRSSWTAQISITIPFPKPPINAMVMFIVLDIYGDIFDPLQLGKSHSRHPLSTSSEIFGRA